MLADHFVLLVLLAGLIAAFLALLFRDVPGERKRMFVRIFTALVVAAVGIAWIFRLAAG